VGRGYLYSGFSLTFLRYGLLSTSYSSPCLYELHVPDFYLDRTPTTPEPPPILYNYLVVLEALNSDPGFFPPTHSLLISSCILWYFLSPGHIPLCPNQSPGVRHRHLSARTGNTAVHVRCFSPSLHDLFAGPPPCYRRLFTTNYATHSYSLLIV